MPQHFVFTLEDLDQVVLDALERRRQLREAQVTVDTTAQDTLKERLQSAMQRRMGKPLGDGKAPKA